MRVRCAGLMMAAALIISLAMMAQPGTFEGHGDVGTVLHPGAVEYDAGQKTYRITVSGENYLQNTRSEDVYCIIHGNWEDKRGDSGQYRLDCTWES